VRPGTTGKPVPGYELKLTDEQGSEVKRGELGELQIAGPTACERLLEQPRQEPQHLHRRVDA
jgi:2-aminobenzoate-CoA ligase